MPVAGRRERPIAVLPRDVQQQRVLRAHLVAAERDVERRRPDRTLRRVRPTPVRPARAVPIVRHGDGRQRRDVLQPGVQGRGGLLEREPRPVRAEHAGHAAQRFGWPGELPERPEGGQGACAADLDAQQRAAQVSVRKVEPRRNQLQGNDRVHGPRGQGHGLRVKRYTNLYYVPIVPT